MKPAIAHQLIEALRSGKYKHTKGYFRRDGHHCANGVLIDLAVQAGVEHWMSEPWYNQVAAVPASGWTRDAGWLSWSGATEAESNHIARINNAADSYEPVIAFLENRYPYTMPTLTEVRQSELAQSG